MGPLSSWGVPIIGATCALNERGANQFHSSSKYLNEHASDLVERDGEDFGSLPPDGRSSPSCRLQCRLAGCRPAVFAVPEPAQRPISMCEAGRNAGGTSPGPRLSPLPQARYHIVQAALRRGAEAGLGADAFMHEGKLCDRRRAEHKRIKIMKAHAAVDRVDGER
jgi:hypothetical protein